MTDSTDFTQYSGPRQKHIDRLKGQGVDIWSMIRPYPIRRAVGIVTPEPERFRVDPDGDDWLVFVEPDDVIYWHPETGQLVSWNGLAFALGEEAIINAGTFALDACLEVWADPVEWLRNGRTGIVVVNWQDAYERLGHCPRVSLPQSLVAMWQQHMKPKHEPKVYVRPERRVAA